jgi:membrane associated rhomboid family serine protease
MSDPVETGGITTTDAAGSPGAETLWCSLPAGLDIPGVPTPLSTPQMRARSLALQARHIPCRIVADGLGWRLLVRSGDVAAALDELRQFEAENDNWPPLPPPSEPLVDNLFITLSLLGLLAIFYNLTRVDLVRFGLPAIDWVGRGNAAAGAICAGEWWRAVTALTLHSDLQHLLGNLLIGGVFVVLLGRVLGSGLAWALLLASGAGGNLLNAWIQIPLHRSIGASTAIFGAVGLLAAINLSLSPRPLRRRWYLPLAGALALLALLGTGGESTDLGAHLFGFATGIILGVPTGCYLSRHGRPGPWFNALLALACLALVGGAWWAALHVS